MSRLQTVVMPRVILAVALALAVTVVARAQQSACADCHFANAATAPAEHHLLDWDLSPHGRNNVGCERCHGGDETTFESLLAHRDIKVRGEPDYPLSPRNVSATCGVCHTGPFVSFQQSEHYLMLRNGDTSAPTCVTCHGEVRGRLLSAKALESRCNSCHGPGEEAPRARRAAEARELYESIEIVRDELDLARSFIRRIDEDDPRRQRLDDAYQQAEVPITQAIHAGHQFEYDDLVERLDVARERTEALLEELVNRRTTP